MIFPTLWKAGQGLEAIRAQRRRKRFRVVDGDGEEPPQAPAAPVLSRLKLWLALAAVLIVGGAWIWALLVITAAPAHVDPGPFKLAHQGAYIVLALIWVRLGHAVYQRVAHPPVPPSSAVEVHHHYHKEEP